MARIPQFVSKENASTEAPAVMQRDEKVGVMADSNIDISGAQETGKMLTQLGEQMVKVENANDLSKAKLQTTTSLMTYEEAFNKNPEKSKSLGTLDSDLQKIGEASSKHFRSSAAKEEFLRDWGQQSLVFKNGLYTKALKQDVDIGRTNTLAAMDLQSSGYINAQNDEEKLKARQQIESTMAEAVKLQLFTHEDGQQEIEKTIKSAEDAIKDRKQLQARKDKELALAQKEAVNARENELIKMKVTGVDKLGTPISREELIKMARNDMAKGDIAPKFADIYINALKSPKAVNAKTIDLDFANIISDINKGTKTPERIKASMLQDLSDGYLSESDFSAANTYFEMLSDKKPDDLVGQNVRKAWFGMGRDIFSPDKAKEAESRARMSRSFISKLQGGVDPQTASLEASREEVLFLQPQAINYPEGMLVIDSSGRQKKVMPNGDLLLVEEKKATTKK